MKKKKLIYGALAILFLICFGVFIYFLKTYDVQPIGPQGTEVGFASFNKSVADSIMINDLLYEMTKLLGLLSIFICLIFAAMGAKQLFERKSLLKVDRDIICLGVLYSLAIISYVLFQKIVINYRPILEDGELAASFPSSHTVLSIVVFVSLLFEINRRVNDPLRALIGEISCLFMVCLAVGGRLLSGWHWATDIIGGIILSTALIFIFLAILPEKENKEIDKKITNCEKM